ncbi:hypothetical protein Tco_1238641 [Tanacetum coccineum]
MAAFKVLETQFQMFIKSRIYLDDNYVVTTRNYFLQYTQLEILEFCDTLIQHVESVKKSIDEKALHKREYVTRDTSIRSRNDKHDDDTDIRPIYVEEPMVEVETTAEINVFATRQQHTEQPEFNNEGEDVSNAFKNVISIFSSMTLIASDCNSERIERLYGGGGIPFQLKSDSLPHAHAQTTKTYYKHQDSSIKKAQVLKTKTFANSDKQDLPLRYQVYQGRLLASFQDDAKYEHVGQDTRSQGGKDDQD